MNETIDVVREALKSLTGVDPMFMATSDKQSALSELAAVQAQVAELRLRVLATAGDVAEDASARDVGAWLAVATRARRGDAAADVRLASALDDRYDQVAAGMREGWVSPEQAHAICRALDRLPADVDQTTRGQAERVLVGYAESFDPAALTRLGRRVLDVVAPEQAEAHETRALADLEASARQRARLTLRAQGDGTTRLSGLIPDATAARLATYLHAYTNPRRPDGLEGADGVPREGVGDDGTPPGGLDREGVDREGPGAEGSCGQPLDTHDRPTRNTHPRRLAHAFCQLVEDLDPHRLPLHGGDATTVVVTMSLDSLRAELGTAAIETGLPGDPADRVTAQEARRLACRAHLVPAVLDSAGEVLDLGRAQRLFSRAQRRALLLRDKTCRAEGCDIPGTWTEAHHWIPWSHGGRTDLADGVLLCSRHHHRAHDPTHTAERLPNGDVRFTRRT